MDGGAVLNMAPGSMSFVVGGLITEPAKIESGLKKLVDAMAQSEGDDCRRSRGAPRRTAT